MSAQIPNIEDTRELLKKNQIGIVGVGKPNKAKFLVKVLFIFYQKHLNLQLRMQD